jgi:hypothetical protein
MRKLELLVPLTSFHSFRGSRSFSESSPDTMSRKTDRGKIRVEYTRVLSLPRLRVYNA